MIIFGYDVIKRPTKLEKATQAQIKAYHELSDKIRKLEVVVHNHNKHLIDLSPKPDSLRGLCFR